ncbi:hypothetical protein GA0074695_1529 [Micromonospora viridifaciens]|uniref:Uncharacterized protein n=1 Tax=Micromonospora viridifaciens TaxID=1881 RepID=A0A1C4VJJ0_MICVI|nr:hypothetical protein [Micromonospora viridifaciens]SCE84126.1 hypothetical protein GA0074695_1529 [Micromonospora viridifaciens]
MTDTAPERPLPDPPPDLTPDALDLWEDILTHHGATITTIGFGALVQSVKLVALADRAEEAIGSDFVVIGFRGAPVSNPLFDTVRQARTAAVTALKTVGANLGDAPSGTNAGRALAGARWRKAR